MKITKTELKSLIKTILVEESANGPRQTVYHGDSFGLTYINGNYDLMSQKGSNQQEGPGIYFAKNQSTTKRYGNKVVSLSIDPERFIPSRDKAGSHITPDDLANALIEMHKDEDDMWYMLADYGIPVAEPEDVAEYHWEKLAELFMNEQVRNLLILLDENAGTQNFIEKFTRHVPVYGTYWKQDFMVDGKKTNDIWYAVLYNDEELEIISD
jgi:hypothetical protein